MLEKITKIELVEIIEKQAEEILSLLKTNIEQENLIGELMKKNARACLMAGD